MDTEKARHLFEKAKMDAYKIATTNADKYFTVNADLYNQGIALLKPCSDCTEKPEPQIVSQPSEEDILKALKEDDEPTIYKNTADKYQLSQIIADSEGIALELEQLQAQLDTAKAEIAALKGE